MNRLILAALGLAGALGLAACYSGEARADPAPLGAPCSVGPCKVTGAAVGVAIPLPLGSAKPKLRVAQLSTPVERAPKPLRLTIPPPGNFVGKFELVPLEDPCVKRDARTKGAFVAKCPRLKNGHQLYAERNTYLFRTMAGDYVAIFAGQPTDLASTPSATWSVLPPDGAGAKEFPPHDACYESKGTFDYVNRSGQVLKVGRTRKSPYTRAECDEILRQAMVALRVPDWKRITIWSGVRAGGHNGWGH